MSNNNVFLHKHTQNKCCFLASFAYQQSIFYLTSLQIRLFKTSVYFFFFTKSANLYWSAVKQTSLLPYITHYFALFAERNMWRYPENVPITKHSLPEAQKGETMNK